MRLQKNYKPSFHLQNAPYRGELKLPDYMNTMQEIAHDIVLLNRIAYERHLPQIERNFSSLITGESSPSHFNHFSASTLYRIHEKDAYELPPLTEWLTVGSPVVTDTSIQSTTSTDVIGIYTSIFAEAGNPLYIRVKVGANNPVETFTIGSNNIQTKTGVGAFKTITVNSADPQYIDFFLEPTTDQTINLVLYVRYHPSVIVNETITIYETLACPATVKEVVAWPFEQAKAEIEKTKDSIEKRRKNEVIG
jgi:hypothetical protein